MFLDTPPDEDDDIDPLDGKYNPVERVLVVKLDGSIIEESFPIWEDNFDRRMVRLEDELLKNERWYRDLQERRRIEIIADNIKRRVYLKGRL